MDCKKCKNKLDKNAIFCTTCGLETDSLKTGLSAKENFKQTWKMFKLEKHKYYSFASVYFFVAIIPLIAVILFTKDHYIWNNLSLLFVIPLALVPFTFDYKSEQIFTANKYFRNLKHYPQLLLFTLVNILYLFAVKMICTGHLEIEGNTVFYFITDPILHLVRFVLILYWFAIVAPMPFLIFQRKFNVLKALKVIYNAGKETRWQQFFTVLYTTFSLLTGALALVLGLLVAIPFSFVLLQNYYQRMEGYDLINNPQG